MKSEMTRAPALAAAMMLSLPSLVVAAQIIPTGVEYTNDTIEQRGRLQRAS